MPGRRLQQSSIDQSLCRRCQAVVPSITVRTEPLCKACFSKYVQTKVVKRMESFRVRHAAPGQERRLLLPIAFDHCSVGLLHILSHHLRGQAEKTGRTGFKLHVLHVKNASHSESQDAGDRCLGRAKSAYPEHDYHSVELSDVLGLDGVHDLINDTAIVPDQELPVEERLQQVLGSLGSVTSRTDFQHLLSRKLVVDYAKTHSCEAIVWSDSTTRLAERTLAETAKGRGFSLPWMVADGESPYGVPFYYPLRDLLNKEIEAYVSFVEPPIEELVFQAPSKPAVSTKNTTIDDLMTQYFASVEKEYPSIVANVVKTTGKLQTTSLDKVMQQCELCEMPLDGMSPEKSRLCYGCIRTLQHAGPV